MKTQYFNIQGSMLCLSGETGWLTFCGPDGRAVTETSSGCTTLTLFVTAKPPSARNESAPTLHPKR